MKLVDANYEPPEQTFETLEDGKYKVKGFNWFTLDDKERPILVAQKDGKLVGRLRFILLDDEEGPPMSLTLGEMSMLAKAFGVKNIPNVPDEGYAAMVTKFMIDIKNLCAGKELEVEVKKGWVNSVPGTEVPEGTYWFYISDLSSPERDEQGNPKPKQGDYGRFFFLTFTIDSEKGHPTPYKGASFTELVPYAFEVNDKGEVIPETIKEGKYAGQPTGEASRLSNIMRLGAPNVFASEFIPPNPHNLLPFMKQKFLETRQILEGQRILIEKKNKGKVTRRIGLSWPGVKIVEGYQAPKRIIESMNVDDKCRSILVEALDLMAGGPSVVSGSFELTEIGRKAAKEAISPLKEQGVVEKKHNHLEEITVEEVISILTSLVDRGEEFKALKEKAVAMGIGIEIRTDEEVEEDSPF